MKKIRLLALLLALLMVFSVVLVACGDDGEEPKKPSTTPGGNDDDDDDDDQGGGNSNVVMDNDGSRTGYEMYFHFNAAEVGRFPALSYSATADKYMEYQRAPYSTYFNAPNKGGGSYRIEKKVGSDTDGCLLIHREEGSNTDPFIDILAGTALGNLDNMHTLSFKVRLEDGLCGSSSIVRGRKVVSGTTAFMDFLRIDNASLYDCNGGTVYGPESDGYAQGWHTIHLFINDDARTYNIYVDGYKVTKNPIAYNNVNYPASDGAIVDVYRISIEANASRTAETFLYLDDIFVQNTNTDTEYIKGENFLGGGLVHYDSITATYKNGLFTPSVDFMLERLALNGADKYRQEIFSSKLSMAGASALAKKTADGEVVDLFEDYGVYLGYYDKVSEFVNGDKSVNVWSERVGGKYVGKIAYVEDTTDEDAVAAIATYTIETVKGENVIVFAWDGVTPSIGDALLGCARFDETTGVLAFYADDQSTDIIATFKLNKSVVGNTYTSADAAYSVEFIDDALVDATLDGVDGEFAYVVNDDGTITVIVDETDDSKNVTLTFVAGKNTVLYGETKLLPPVAKIDTTLAKGEKYVAGFGDYKSTNKSIFQVAETSFVDGFKDPAVFSQYTKILFKFYASKEMVNDNYKFLVYVNCGNNEGGISYYSIDFMPNSTVRPYVAGWNTYVLDIASFGKSRTPDLVRFGGLELAMSGWSNGIPATAGTATDGYYMYVEELTFITTASETFRNAADGMSACKHENSELVYVGIEEGKTAYSCGHAYCAHGDYYINKCSDCGFETPVADYISKSNAIHNYSNVLQIKNPKCGVDGYSYYACEDCGYENVQETYPALSHVYYEESEVEGNYIVKNLLCTVCGSKSRTQGYSELIEFTQKIYDSKIPSGQYLYYDGRNASFSYGVHTQNGQTFTDNTARIFEITHKFTKFEAKETKEGSGIFGIEYSRNPDSDAASYFLDAYIDVNTAKDANSILVPMGTRFVCEIDLMLGNKGADGKYPTISSSFMDRGWNGSNGAHVGMFNINTDGVFTFGTYTLELSDTKFTNFAFYFKPDENVIELYVNGVLTATKAIATTVEKAMTFLPCDWRTTYVANKTNEMGASFWLNNICYYITNSGPACVLIDKSDITNANREVKLQNERLEELTYPLTVDAADVVGYVPADYRNDKYVFEATFNGADLADGVLLEGWKRNNGYDYYENLLEVKDGKIYCCGVLISKTTENVKIALLLNDVNKGVSVYVNGELIPGGSFAYNNAFYAESNAIKGFVFKSGIGSYTVDGVRVYSGDELKPVPTPEA